MEKLQHVLEAQQFTRTFLETELFPLTKKMEQVARERNDHSLSGKIVYHLFYEPSTRTRISFETATTILGGIALSTENASAFSSAIKGETVEDTVRVINGYHHNAIIIRHKEEGAAARAAVVSKIPIINAGDGTGQHPTQALLDVYTIYEHFQTLDGIRVAMVGDLAHGRTVNSLAYLMAKFRGIHIDFVSPTLFRVQQDIKDYLERHPVSYNETTNLGEVLKDIDVLYMTRAQTERFRQGERFDNHHGGFKMDLVMLNRMQPNSIVMHPLPRNDELPPELDNDPRVVCFRQAQNGLYVRMALLKMLLS